MTWYMIVAGAGLLFFFFAWLVNKYPNRLGGDQAGASILTGIFAFLGLVALVVAFFGKVFS